jgi:pyruvate, orthophosphate dikinase
VEKAKGAKFGNPENPLLVSVRSGARVSMPGMMDTVLNLGMTEEITRKLAEKNPVFAWNSYWRFIFMFADVVMGVRKEELGEVLEKLKKEKNIKEDTRLSEKDWYDTVYRLKARVKKITGREVPQDPKKQLWMAIEAVFKSWNNPRALTYRKLNRISDDWGTAVNVQSMAFGNINENSASGVGFTRNPATGQKNLYGEFLIKAQGEDVVAGMRTPRPLFEMKKAFPSSYRELLKVAKILEKYYRDMQDIEFTVENGKLWMLQTRTGKRTAQAALKIALDQVKEGLISKKEALARIDPGSIETLFKPQFDLKAKRTVLEKGLPSSPGAAVGEVVFDSGEAEKMAEKGHKVVLVRIETSPDDISGIASSEGILTSRGGFTSHAALVARAMGKPSVVGCEKLYIDYKKQSFRAGNKTVKKGDYISIDGTSGEVILGAVPTRLPEARGELGRILDWADKERKLKVYANADSPEEAKKARSFGAEGIGLCRTEHMFFKEDRLESFQQMILADSREEREEALKKILPLQRGDFTEIFKAMRGQPVIIRLLDPPLHEFLPRKESEIRSLAKLLDISPGKLHQRVESLRENNPMLGHRGCRLGLTYPEIYEVQTRAIMEAACLLRKKRIKVIPEIMIPLTLDLEEFRIIRKTVEETCKKVFAEMKSKISCKIGTMIELPRAALMAGEIAKEAEFFSFGTNDLTQTALGISRDDAGRFLPQYMENKIFERDPFVSLDQAGVGELIKIARERGKASRPSLEVGICGEHGGDPDSIEFFHKAGLDYVSCSTFRVPAARLAAAQASLKN